MCICPMNYAVLINSLETVFPNCAAPILQSDRQQRPHSAAGEYQNGHPHVGAATIKATYLQYSCTLWLRSVPAYRKYPNHIPDSPPKCIHVVVSWDQHLGKLAVNLQKDERRLPTRASLKYVWIIVLCWQWKLWVYLPWARKLICATSSLNLVRKRVSPTSSCAPQ